MNNRSQTIFLGFLRNIEHIRFLSSVHMTVSDENLDKIYYG